jgi:hypothetical protein
MSKVWVLDTDTKGTGARMVPLDKVLAKPEAAPERPRRRPPASKGSGSRRPRKPSQPVERSATPLPPGHVRKKATGEIGRVRSVDAKAGTATVHWLKDGRTSSVPLAALSRR